MSRRINFARAQINELKDVQAASIGDIQRVKVALKAVPKPAIRISALIKIAMEALPSNPKLAEQLIRLGVLLSTLSRRNAMTVADLQKSLEVSAAGFGGEDDAAKARWQNIAEIAFVNSVYLSSKALDLSFDFERLFASAKLITDIRPVFNESAEEPMGAVIVHTLHLSFYQDDRFVSLSVALDGKDIGTLADACSKALKKQETSRNLLRQMSSDEIFVAGDERHESDG